MRKLIRHTKEIWKENAPDIVIMDFIFLIIGGFLLARPDSSEVHLRDDNGPLWHGTINKGIKC